MKIVQVQATHSISAGLDYPGVGPEHAFLKDKKRVLFSAVTDVEALGQRYENLLRAKRSEIVSKRAEIGNAERAAQLLREEIKSLDGPKRALALFNAKLLEDEIARKKEQAGTLIPNLEATPNCVACASASYLALVRINRKAESTYMN